VDSPDYVVKQNKAEEDGTAPPCRKPGGQLADLKLGASPPPNAPWITGIPPIYGQNQRNFVLAMDNGSLPGRIPSSTLPPFHPPQPLIRGPETPEEIYMPQWLRQPSPQQIQAAYPRQAARMRVSRAGTVPPRRAGKATVSCKVAENGTLKECEILGETPEKQRFGDAAMSLTGLYQMKPLLPNGAQVTGAKVKVEIAFTPPQGPTGVVAPTGPTQISIPPAR
jgi:TonB family protein